MFVEQLTRDEIIDYITKDELTKYLTKYDDYVSKEYDFNEITDYEVSEGEITFRIRDKKFKLTDFDYTTNYTTTLYNGFHCKSWLSFMYKRFGNPYKIAFLSFREQEKRDILEAAAKRFDEDTAEYEDGLECK